MIPEILVDSNILIDIFDGNGPCSEWSNGQVRTWAQTHMLAINPIIYAEIAHRFSRQDDLDTLLEDTEFSRLDIPWEAAFLAAKAYAKYRAQGGVRINILPDFFIGAHATVSELPLLTRDTARYRHYFPKVELIHP